jgi:hypothetical protein
MNEVMRTMQSGVNPMSRVSSTTPAEGINDVQPVALVLEMQSSAALLSVLTTVARLGCHTTHVHATERQATLGVLAPCRVAHRLLPCLGELIEVLAVREASAGLS